MLHKRPGLCPKPGSSVTGIRPICAKPVECSISVAETASQKVDDGTFTTPGGATH